MAMQFDEFVREVNGAVRTLGPVESFDDSSPTSVTWKAGERKVAVALVPPLNVSVALGSPGRPDVTTWYPVDPALVPVVSSRIAAFLSES
jgi:hypothetical protein